MRLTERNLVICDAEFRYANLLAKNIEMREELSVKVYVCSGINHVLFLAKERKIHILIIDEIYSYEERKSILANQVFVLSKNHVNNLDDEEVAIRKYQSADSIIREIFETYMEKTKENMIRTMRKRVPKILAVYSPIHRTGKTTFAIALGQEYAKQKKTLYINQEEYAGFEDYFGEGLNLGDLLYYIKQGRGNIGIRLQSAIKKKKELDIISPIPISLDLKEISEQEWRMLLEQIVENSVYEYIILDIGESVQGLFQLLELCDRIYMPIQKDEISQRKIRCYEENIRRLGYEKIFRITSQFVLPDNIEEYAKIRAKEEC